MSGQGESRTEYRVVEDGLQGHAEGQPSESLEQIREVAEDERELRPTSRFRIQKRIVTETPWEGIEDGSPA